VLAKTSTEGSNPSLSAKISINNFMISCKIIEDCRPYYIRYTFDGLDRLIETCKSKIEFPDNELKFNRVNIDFDLADEIINFIPYKDKIQFNKQLAALYVSQPGLYYGAHKDGLACKVSYNFAISINDDKCVTSWYDEEEFNQYKVVNDYIPAIDYKLKKLTSREIIGFDKSKHTPVKTMTLNPNEAVLINTDIWHDWDNTQSNNERIVLTIRPIDPTLVTIEEAKNIIFGP
jgi:hypothetical protein